MLARREACICLQSSADGRRHWGCPRRARAQLDRHQYKLCSCPRSSVYPRQGPIRGANGSVEGSGSNADKHAAIGSALI